MAKVRVLHAYYGCETGCCGHVIEIDEYRVGEFGFFHEYGGLTPAEIRKKVEPEVIRTFGKDHVSDLDWETAEVLPDEDCNW